MSTSSGGDPFGPLYRMLDEIQMKHFEMGQRVAEYKELVERLEDRADADDLRLARALPGAKYHVDQTYVRELWLKVTAEITVMFPPDEPT